MSLQVMSQAPLKINYQAIARNPSTGEVMGLQSIFVSFKIRVGGASGTIVYQESHPGAETNEFGLFHLLIGDGNPVFGTMENINWGVSDYWLEIDIDTGNGLETVGAIQLVSVPYAFHANTVSNADDADADPTNELIGDFTLDEENLLISIVDEGGEYTISLQGILESNDTDPTNELVTDLIFDENTYTLGIQQQGQELSVDLSSLINDADADPANEKISGVFYAQASNSLTITEAGQNYSTGLGPVDHDTDPANELVTNFFFDTATSSLSLEQLGSSYVTDLSPLIDDDDPDPSNELVDQGSLQLSADNVFSFTEAGVNHFLDLSALAENYWNKNELNNTVFNTANRIGIGAANPSARLEVRASVTPPEPAFRVFTAPGDPVFSVEAGTIATSPESNFRLNGQMSVGVKILTNISGSYAVLPEDIAIVVIRGVLPLPLTIQLPDATQNNGRILVIKSVGPSVNLQPVSISPQGQLIDFNSASINMSASNNESVTLLSIGNNGWVRIQ